MADHNIEINVHLHDEDVINQLREISKQIDKLKATQTINVRTNVDMSGLNRLISGLQTASSLASGLSSVFDGLASFSGGIGNAFTGMSNLFKVDLLNTSKRYLTAMATRAVTGNIGDILSRYDILSTFTPYMQIAGVDATTANTALQRVNQSILGLPIGLDESAYRLRRYQMLIGDTEQATNLTIGLQNALTAGGASESMKNTAYVEMERLLTTGDLATFRQWQALMTGFGVSSRFIADALSEITGRQVNVQQLTEGLHDGTYAVSDLMQALEYLGQDWSNVPDNLVPQFVKDMNSALDIYKGTTEAWVSNIQFAVTRGGANLLSTLNETMKLEQGMGVTDVLSNVRDLINDIFGWGSEFTSGHPELLQTAFDIVGGLMDRAKGFDWELFSTNVVTNIGKLFDIIFSVFDSLPPGSLEEFASFAMTIAGPIGQLFSAVQQGLPSMLGVFRAFKDFDFGRLVGDITHQVDVFASAIERILNLVGDERMSKLLAFGLVWGGPLSKGLSGLGSLLGGAANIARLTGGGGGIKGLFSGLAGRAATVGELLPGVWPVVGAAAGIWGLLAGVNVVETNYRKEMSQENAEWLKERLGDSLDVLNDTEPLLEEVASKRESFDKNFNEVYAETDMAVNLIERIRSAHDKLKSSTLTAQERATLKEQLQADLGIWNTMFPDVELSAGGALGGLDLESATFVADYADQYVELQNARAFIDATDTARRETAADIVRQEAQLNALQNSLAEQKDAVRETYEDLVVARGAQQKGLGENLNILKREQQVAAVEYAEDRYNQARDVLHETQGQIDDTTESIAKSYEMLNKYNISWSEYSDTVRRLSAQNFVVDGEVQAFEELTEAQQEYIAAHETFRQEAYESIQSQLKGFDQVEGVNATPISTLTSGLESQTEKLNYTNDALLEIDAALRDMDTETLERYGAAIGEILDIAEGDFGERGMIFGLRDALQGDWEGLDAFVTEFEEKALGEDGYANKLADIRSVLTGGSEYEQESGKTPTLFEGLPETLQQLQELSQIDLGGFGENASGAAKDVEPFAEAVQQTSSHAQEAKANLDEMKTSVETTASTASNKQGTMSQFGSVLSTVGGMASSAASMVERLAGAISSLQSKTVELRVNMGGAGAINGSFGAAVAAARAARRGEWATGGWADNPKSFSAFPRGTDTIPAWLSPGEFVVNSRAAKMFGSGFLEKVNGMDIGGAFDSLMHNLARPEGLYGPTINFNRDNHASVIINNHGETGQGYSQRKAYKWASAL